MKVTFILILFLSSSIAYSQMQEFTGGDLKNVIKITKFQGVKTLKNIDTPQEINNLINWIYSESGVLKQLNIDGWFICESEEAKDNFDTYNYYYRDIPRYTYDNYCKELNALMI